MKIKPILKLILLILVPYIIGGLLRTRLDQGIARLFLDLTILGGILVIPLFAETIYKSQMKKTKGEIEIKASKVSGFLFLIGMILFCMGLGYLTAG